MLADVIRDRSDQPVYGLAFHVDYWNYLGWEDRFSDKRFTQRQRKYARARQTTRVYTPQMIINGQVEFNGSRRQRAEQCIASTLRTPSTATVRLQTKTQAADSLVVATYDVTTEDGQLDLNLALVESELESQVTSGENAGRTLQHVDVVRGFQTISLAGSASGEVEIALPHDVKPEHARVIAYVQHPQTLRVVGATRSEPLGK